MIGATIGIMTNTARAEAHISGNPYGASASAMNPKTKISLVGMNRGLMGHITSILSQTSVELRLITELRVADYLKVDKHVLWVTPDVIEQLNIMSNVEWTIT